MPAIWTPVEETGGFVKLDDVIRRRIPPEPWDEGDKIPWHDPEFSRRMLHEHLSQAHDHASRRSELIDEHVDWIHRELLGARPSRVLDLGCGPGLYTARLASLGHACTGIDFSPAAIEYARSRATTGSGRETYLLGDVRAVDFGNGFDLVMLIFGELNMFRIDDARTILRRAHGALVPGGRLLLEAHTFEYVRKMGMDVASWRTSEGGLFAADPYLVLTEHFWHEPEQVATQRTFVVHAADATVDRYVETAQAYSLEDYRSLLEESGLRLRATYPAMPGNPESGEFVVLVGEASTDTPDSTARSG